jgi:hypothetical protein
MYAQDLWFCGNTKFEVKKALTENKKDITEGSVTDSTARISWEIIGDFQMIWVFDSKNSLIFQTLYTFKENGNNEIVKLFNQKFVIISSTKWRNYYNGIVYEIELQELVGNFIFKIRQVKI